MSERVGDGVATTVYFLHDNEIILSRTIVLMEEEFHSLAAS